MCNFCLAELWTFPLHSQNNHIYKISGLFYTYEMNFIRRKIPSFNHYSFSKIFIPYKSYHLAVEPQTCLQDMPISICATGLKPNENATISAMTDNDHGEKFFSYAYYKADSFGCIDLKMQSSLGGSYKGCLPMGLLSSLQNVDIEKKYHMFIKRKTDVPLKLNINLMRGFMGREKCATSQHNDYLTSINHERHYIAKGGVRIPIREGRLRGTLFLPPGKGPFPGVIDLYGTNGGLKEARAAQLSSNGFATFALAYFRYDDLPALPTEIDLEYFEEAIQYLLKHKQVSSNGCAVMGSSLGSEIALAMAIYLKGIKAVVASTGIPAVTFWPLKYKDMFIPAIEPDLSKIKAAGDMIVSKDILKNTSEQPESILPLEKINANILFLIAKDDQNMYSFKEMQEAAKRMRLHGKSNYEIAAFDGAGHMLEPPFTQFCDRMYHIMPKTFLFLGGNINEHTKAEQIAWSKTLKFLKKNLI